MHWFLTITVTVDLPYFDHQRAQTGAISELTLRAVFVSRFKEPFALIFTSINVDNT